MDELKMTGNHLKGSRPLLSFDKNFDSEPHLRILKELLLQVRFVRCTWPMRALGRYCVFWRGARAGPQTNDKHP